MKKVREDDFEYLYLGCDSVFGSHNNKNTCQELYLTHLCRKNIGSNSIYSFREMNMIKRKFLLWQSNENPNMNWIEQTDYYHEITLPYNHSEDLSWNDLTIHIDRWVSIFVREIGCMEYSDFKRIEYMNNSYNGDWG